MSAAATYDDWPGGYRNRMGIPISKAQFWVLWKRGLDYRRVAAHDTPGRTMWISTIWTGRDYGALDGGAPMIFETRVDGWGNDDHEHYSDEHLPCWVTCGG